MASVTIMTAGAKSASGTSSAVDTSASAQLRLDLVASADHGKGPVLDFVIETGPAATGPWTEIYAAKFDARQPTYSPIAWPPGPKRLILGNVDLFTRARWSAQATKNSGDGDPSLYLGLTGTDA